MGIYGGIQLPNISEENLDDKKERKQILNYLALLDEKLRYMFQNIDIEENLSEESKEMFLEMGQEIKNLVQDTDGRFSMLTQTVDGINTLVSDPNKGLSAISQKADSISATVNGLNGTMSEIRANLDGISLFYTSDSGRASITIGNVTVPLYDRSGVGKLVEDEVAGINLDGYVTFSALKNGEEDEDGDEKTVINGNLITTGKVSADHIGLYGRMKVYQEYDESKYISTGGYFGYMDGDDPLNGSTAGIGMTDYSKSGGVICHGSGSAIWYEDFGITIDSYDVNFIGDYNFYLATNFYCEEDGKAALGKKDNTWAILYADSCTCCTSDERRKNSIGYDLTEYEGLFERLKPTQFKMNNGTSDRYHIGFISQDVEKALEDVGLTSRDFAGFIKSPVYEKDEKGKEIEGGEVLDYSYGLRYEEFIALNTHMIQKLMARVSELENKLEALS